MNFVCWKNSKRDEIQGKGKKNIKRGKAPPKYCFCAAYYYYKKVKKYKPKKNNFSLILCWMYLCVCSCPGVVDQRNTRMKKGKKRFISSKCMWCVPTQNYIWIKALRFNSENDKRVSCDSSLADLLASVYLIEMSFFSLTFLIGIHDIICYIMEMNMHTNIVVEMKILGCWW